VIVRTCEQHPWNAGRDQWIGNRPKSEAICPPPCLVQIWAANGGRGVYLSMMLL